MTNFIGNPGDDTVFGEKGRTSSTCRRAATTPSSAMAARDHIYFGAAFTAEDGIHAGFRHGKHETFHDGTVELTGDYSAGVVFGAATMINVRTLVLDGGHSYDFTFNKTTVADNPMAVAARTL